MIQPTQVVFQSPAIQFINGDYYKVMTTRSVKKNEILIIELVASGTREELASLIHLSPILFENLYPRTTTTWRENDDSSIVKELVTQKYCSNAFNLNDVKTLALHISSFNHSTEPNAEVIDKQVLISSINHTIHFKAVVSTQDIPANTEIKICYSLLLNDRCEFYTDERKTPTEKFNHDENVVKKIVFLIQLHLKKNTAETQLIIMAHYLFNKGLSVFSGNNKPVIFKDIIQFLKEIGSNGETDLNEKVFLYIKQVLPSIRF